jgi:bifunctional DNase/RNase
LPRLLTNKEVDVVEVAVYDVLLRVPKGVELQWPQDASKVGRMALVVLKEREGERTMGIWVGVPEANAMIQPLAKLAVPRPMTHDLLSRLLEVNNTHVEKVAVTTLHDTTFYATLWLRVGERVQ